MRNCNKCTKENLCDRYDNLVNRKKKDFSESLIELKRQTFIEFGQMLPKYKAT